MTRAGTFRVAAGRPVCRERNVWRAEIPVVSLFLLFAVGPVIDPLLKAEQGSYAGK
jgi:hypothetical protein